VAACECKENYCVFLAFFFERQKELARTNLEASHFFAFEQSAPVARQILRPSTKAGQNAPSAKFEYTVGDPATKENC
jgi:hypothetical protein